MYFTDAPVGTIPYSAVSSLQQDSKAIDKDAFSDLVANIRKAEALAELQNKNYTSEYQYVEMFGTEDYVYTLNIGDELTTEMETIYAEFANWLGSWEM